MFRQILFALWACTRLLASLLEKEIRATADNPANRSWILENKALIEYIRDKLKEF